MKREKSSRWLIFAVWGVLAMLVIGWLINMGLSVWNTYKNDIISKQKEQLLIIVESLADHLEETIESRSMALSRLSEELLFTESLAEEGTEEALWTQIFTNYLTYNEEVINYITLRDGEGAVLWCNGGVTYPQIFSSYNLAGEIVLTECINDRGEVSFLLSKELADGRTLEMSLDVLSYYNRMISDIKIGTSGYVVVKNEEGILFMHPEPLQLGLNVIDGRADIYEGVNLTSLEVLVEQQNANDSGVYEYTSYWWLDESLPEVRKIASHAHAQVGDGFLVVSAVMEYDDIYLPIQTGFTHIALMFVGILAVILAIFLYFLYLMAQQRKNRKEIAYLRDLNEVLEETKRTESTIIHQQRLQIMGTMTGGIAHEFNNMLTPIMGYAEMLQWELDPQSEGYDYAQEILNGAERAKDVITQISSLSKKNLETVLRFIPVRGLLVRAMKMIRPMCGGHIAITLENIQDSTVGFLGNETQLSQILLNLISNANHAIGQRPGGAITIRCAVVSADVLTERGLSPSQAWGHYVELQVEDNGCGMEPSMKEQIFNPFFTTKVQGEGVGLGLSVVEQMIQNHRGYITLDSQVGVGTTFYIYLPVAQQVEALPPETGTQDTPYILILDNNERILQLLLSGFQRLHLPAVAADTIEEARALLSQREYQAIFIDQHLSRTNGDDLGLHFAMSIHEQYPLLAKVMMTDQVRREIIEAKQAGFVQGYVEKPVSDAAILEVMRNLELSS